MFIDTHHWQHCQVSRQDDKRRGPSLKGKGEVRKTADVEVSSPRTRGSIRSGHPEAQPKDLVLYETQHSRELVRCACETRRSLWPAGSREAHCRPRARKAHRLPSPPQPPHRGLSRSDRRLWNEALLPVARHGSLLVFEALAEAKWPSLIFTIVYAKPNDDPFVQRASAVIEKHDGEGRVSAPARREFKKLTTKKQLEKNLAEADIESAISFRGSLELDTEQLSAARPHSASRSTSICPLTANAESAQCLARAHRRAARDCLSPAPSTPLAQRGLQVCRRSPRRR